MSTSLEQNQPELSSTASAAAFTFFGKMLTFSRVRFTSNDLTAIEAHLHTLLSHKNSQIPVVIESKIEQDLPALLALLREWGLQPIGVVTGILDSQAQAERLAIFPAEGQRIGRLPAVKSSTAEQPTSASAADAANVSPPTVSPTFETSPSTPEMPEHAPTVEQINSHIYDQMLRSGQSINQVGGDLILTKGINDGAEAITDNNLHVYGHAKGRLVAGATGDKAARIFCQKFNPSLVSVAGTYCLRDSLPSELIDRAVEVSYQEDEGLIFTPMNDA